MNAINSIASTGLPVVQPPCSLTTGRTEDVRLTKYSFASKDFPVSIVAEVKDSKVRLRWEAIGVVDEQAQSYSMRIDDVESRLSAPTQDEGRQTRTSAVEVALPVGSGEALVRIMKDDEVIKSFMVPKPSSIRMYAIEADELEMNTPALTKSKMVETSAGDGLDPYNPLHLLGAAIEFAFDSLGQTTRDDFILLGLDQKPGETREQAADRLTKLSDNNWQLAKTAKNAAFFYSVNVEENKDDALLSRIIFDGSSVVFGALLDAFEGIARTGAALVYEAKANSYRNS